MATHDHAIQTASRVARTRALLDVSKHELLVRETTEDVMAMYDTEWEKRYDDGDFHTHMLYDDIYNVVDRVFKDRRGRMRIPMKTACVEKSNHVKRREKEQRQKAKVKKDDVEKPKLPFTGKKAQRRLKRLKHSDVEILENLNITVTTIEEEESEEEDEYIILNPKHDIDLSLPVRKKKRRQRKPKKMKEIFPFERIFEEKKQRRNDVSKSCLSFCSFKIRGVNCKRTRIGTCPFAHNYEDITPCEHGDTCRNISYRPLGVLNVTGFKVCRHRHPRETERCWKLRVEVKPVGRKKEKK